MKKIIFLILIAACLVSCTESYDMSYEELNDRYRMLDSEYSRLKEHCEELEEELYISSSSSESTTFRCRDYTLKIPRENMEAYIICNRFTMYAVVMDEVDYQRKGLNERGWDLMACDNCEYTDNYDAVKAMVDEGGLSETFLTNWKEGETVFCPWW